jgi:hypothetical protein
MTDPGFFVAAFDLADSAGGLRRSCGGLVPLLVHQWPSRGRPAHRSTELVAVLDSMAAEMLSPERVRARGLFDPGDVQALVTRRSGTPRRLQRADQLWSLLLVEAWCQAYLDRRGAAPAGRMPSARRQDTLAATAEPTARRRRSDASTLRGDLSPPAGA